MQCRRVGLGLLGLALASQALQTIAVDASQGAGVETVALRAAVWDDAGEPIDAFTLTAYLGSGELHSTTVQDAQGRLATDIDRHARVLTLRAPGRATYAAEIDLLSPGKVDLGDVTLYPAAVVSGRVVDAATGRPLAGARVEFVDPRISVGLALKEVDWRPLGFADTTDIDGAFALHGLPARGSNVVVAAEGYRGRSPTLQAGPSPLGLAIELHPHAVIEGVLATEDGLPAPGSVWLHRDPDGPSRWWEWAILDRLRFEPLQQSVASDGHFRFEGLGSGAYLLSAFSPRGAVKERRVTVGDEDASRDVSLTVERAGSVAGTISGLVEGETVALSVSSGPEDADIEALVRDVGNGAYALAGVQDGPARVRATAKSRIGFRTLWAYVDVKDGQAWVDFDFGFRARLSGIVRAGADTLASVHVVAEPKDARHPRGSGFTNSEGRYELAGLADGDYAVRAEWRTGQVKVEREFDVAMSGQTSADIHFPTASIAGTVVRTDSPRSGPINVRAVAENGYTHEARSDLMGNFRFEHLAEGQYTVMADPAYVGDPRTITVAYGKAMTGIELQLTLSERHELRVEDASSGQPVDRIDVQVRDGPFAGTDLHVSPWLGVPATLAGHELVISKEGYQATQIQWGGVATSVNLTPLPGSPDDALSD